MFLTQCPIVNASEDIFGLEPESDHEDFAEIIINQLIVLSPTEYPNKAPSSDEHRGEVERRSPDPNCKYSRVADVLGWRRRRWRSVCNG